MGLNYQSQSNEKLFVFLMQQIQYEIAARQPDSGNVSQLGKGKQRLRSKGN